MATNTEDTLTNKWRTAYDARKAYMDAMEEQLEATNLAYHLEAESSRLKCEAETARDKANELNARVVQLCWTWQQALMVAKHSE